MQSYDSRKQAQNPRTGVAKVFGQTSKTGNWRQREKKGSAHHKLQDERTWTHADVVLAEAPAAAAAAFRVVSKPPVLRRAKQLPCIQKSFQWSFASGAVSVSGSGSGHGNGKGSQRQAHRRTHTYIQNGCRCGTKSVMAHEKLPGHAQDFIIMCLGRKTMAAEAAAAAAPHAGNRNSQNESRIVRLNVSGGFHFSTEHRTELGAQSSGSVEWQPLRLWPETKRIRWRKLK